jgi:ATP-dependent DNA helicase RecG
MGIFTAGDLLRCYPRAYQNRGDTVPLSVIREKLKNGESDGPFSVLLTIAAEPSVSMIRRGMTLLKVRAFDETDAVEITYFNQTYLRDKLTTGAMFRFFGKFTLEKSKLKLNSPISEPYAEGVPLPDIVPVYPLSSGLTQKMMASLVNEALRMCGNEIAEFLPSDARMELSLPTLGCTLTNIHRPE